MEDAKRRAAIRVQVTKRKEMDEGAIGTGSSRPSAKKRPLLKGDHASKKQKVSTEPVIGLMAEGNKTVTPAKQGGGKGLMVPPPVARTTKTLGTTQRKPWGRWAFSALPR